MGALIISLWCSNHLELILYSFLVASFIIETLDLTVGLDHYADLFELHVHKFGGVCVKIGVQMVYVLHVHSFPFLYDILLN